MVWYNARYRELTGKPPAGAAAGAAPEPTGRLLASFPRKGPQGLDQELRLSREEYQGHGFYSLRLWQRSQAGWFWPLRGKGVSIRLGEAEGLADALRRALDDPAPPPPPAPARPEAAGPRRRERPEGRRDWDRDGSPPAPSKGYDDAY